ncbi:MAG TPA: Ig-like domain-containing protein, partial [bacterium]
ADLSPENQQRDSVRFRMAREDTLGPVLVRAFAPNEREMLLQFDESVTLPPSWKNVKRFEPPDTTTLRNAFVDPADPKRICLLTETQQPKHLYAVALTGLTDMSGNPPDSSSPFVRIEGRAGSDTTVPRLSSVEPKNNNRFVNPSAAIRLVFNEPMDTSRTRSGTTLSDSSGMPVECRLEWDTPSSLTLVPRMLLASLSRYTQTVGPPACDAFGRAMQDTTIGFIVLNADTLSQVSGYALCPDDAATGSIVVSLRQAENPSIVYNRTLAGPGPYAFGAVLPGRYILEAYRDEDGNGRYDFGRPHPFKPSERFAVYSDTIIARSRWPNEGNDLVLP